MLTTDSAHQKASALSEDSELLYRVPLQPSIDGNTVDEQLEQAEFMKNALQHQASFTFLNKKFKGLSLAIKGS
jgi:flagellar basal-body rod protein FlgB